MVESSSPELASAGHIPLSSIWTALSSELTTEQALRDCRWKLSASVERNQRAKLAGSFCCVMGRILKGIAVEGCLCGRDWSTHTHTYTP